MKRKLVKQKMLGKNLLLGDILGLGIISQIRTQNDDSLAITTDSPSYGMSFCHVIGPDQEIIIQRHTITEILEKL